jgi:nitrile hydratase
VASRLVETGRVRLAELEVLAGGRFPLSRPPRPGRIDAAGPDGAPPRFTVGSQVRVRAWHPPGHTRCPRYVRGQTGTVIRVDGSSSLPDVEAHRADRRLEATYAVRFAASDLWGDAQPGVAVYVDLWESYLEEP